MSVRTPPWVKRHFHFVSLMGSDFLDQMHKEQGLLIYELSKLQTILREVETYLDGVIDLLGRVEDETLDWFHKERDLIRTLLKEVSLIELFVALAMTLPRILDEEDVLDLLKHITDQTARAKQVSLQAQTAVSIAAQYHEIRYDNIEDIHREVSACGGLYKSLVDVKLSEDLPSDLTVENIVSKVKLNGSNLSTSIQTPKVMAFTEDEEAFFEKFEQFETRCKPTSVSIQFLEHLVKQFNLSCGVLFPSAIADVNHDYDMLRKAWRKVLNDFNNLRDSAVNQRWRQLCLFLIDHMVLKLDKIQQELQSNRGSQEISDELSISFKTCSNANTLLHKAMIEHLRSDKIIIERFKSEIVPRWKTVNELLSGSLQLSTLPDTPRGSTPEPGEDGLKPVKMIQKRTPLALSGHKESSSTISANGFDLRLGVNPSPNIPISAEKTDRFIDLDIEPNHERSRKLQMALFGLQESSKNEDIHVSHDDSTETLVHPRTPETHPISTRKYKELLHEMSRSQPPSGSKIPIIVSDYIRRCLPVIKKIPSKGSHIPTISPSHPVFISPERRPKSMQISMSLVPRHTSLRTPYMSPTHLRSPPLFTLPKRRVLGRRQSSAGSLTISDFTPRERSRASLLNIRADKISLANQTTPNLAYDAGGIDEVVPHFDRLSLRSTSPDRPGSSIGLRFDESHLVRPVKPTKRAWK